MKKLLVGLLLSVCSILSVAKPVASLVTPEFSIVLHDTECKDGGYDVEMTRGNEKLHGCFAEYDGKIYIMFDNGLKGVGPADAFTPVKNT